MGAGIAIQADGKIVVAGTTGSSPHEKFAIARYIANNVPTIANTTGSFTAIDANETGSPNLGDTVASLLSQLSPSDVDGNTAAQFGLAVTATDNSNGTWQYSIDGGSTWSPISAASDTNALLLAQMTGVNANRIRFSPGPNYTGTSSITVRAWDETQGTNGSTDNITADQANNLNAYGDSSATLSIQVVQPSDVYVNASWAGSSQGQTVSDGFGSHTFGVDAFDTIQQGVSLVASGGTVHIDSATYYVANLLVAKAETIVGVSENGVIVAPSIADGHDNSSFGGSADNAFIIGASGVTVGGLTIDGNANGGLSGSQNFRDAVVTNSPNSRVSYNNTIVDHITAQNIWRKGIGLYSDGSTLSTGNQVTNNTFDAVGSLIGGGAYEATAAIASFGSNAVIDHNVIMHSAGGIEANGAPAPLLTITNNNISLPQTTLANGALGLDLASLAGGSTISGNTINLTGGTGNDIGIVVSYVNGSVTLSNNQITAIGGDDGILLYQDSLSSPPVLLTGNTVASSGTTGTGILLTAQSIDTSRFSDVPGDVYATITGGSVMGFARGISLTTAGSTLQGTIGGGIHITASSNGYGIDIEGANASADIGTATVVDPSIGILINGGSPGSTGRRSAAM